MTFRLSPRALCLLLCLASPLRAQTPQAPAPVDSPASSLQRSQPPAQRIPQQKTIPFAALQGLILDDSSRPVPGVEVRLSSSTSPSLKPAAATSGDGIFRLLRIPPGLYDLTLTRANGSALRRPGVQLNPGEVLSLELRLPTLPDTYAAALPQSQAELLDQTNYTELTRRPDAEGAIVAASEPPLPSDDVTYTPQRDRWEVPFPNYHRYSGNAETPYVLGRWFDPFNRNRYKADKPLFGRTFFSFTGDSISVIEGRRLPVPAGQSTVNPVEPNFFGRGTQLFLPQTFRVTGDLFHGDTAAFRPVDWRIRITAAANINYLKARENQAVSPDVRFGTTRLDTHVSLQEAFGEVKLHDFGQDYDFANIRVGIQQFVSDFRGFIFAEEQPGMRVFGNLHSNRIQYNLAAFDLLEKNTNSGLNTFHRRAREVAIANLFVQDFFTHGYTAQFSYHFARDQATTHYDDNGFLVRPTPTGNVVPHRVDAHYIGWTGDGHIGRYNLTHAVYQVLGNETLNQIANRRTRINAQFAAVELSQDRDWLRFRTSFLYASGSNRPRSGTARGFSSIVDGVAFAGGEFSFFNREGIPFTRAGVALKGPDSFLVDMRSSKDEGQSNFNNPGLFLYNVGADADLTQKLKLVVNANFLQFARTQTLDFLLQQNHVRRTIGLDNGIGLLYRPLLTDNIVVHVGATSLIPGAGLRDIYTSQTLLSFFGLVKFQF